MTASEFGSFSTQSKTNYVNEKMKANGISEAEAQAVADADFARILPDGFHSKDNFLFTLVNENLADVGYLWYCIRGSPNNRKAFIADILVRENFRGKSYGRAAMLLLETHVSSQGLKHIGLHVFGFNDIAQKLYLSMGYQITDLVMEKSL